MVAIGDSVASYKITGVIGRGGMATVYRAHDERLNRDVALKLLDPGYSMDFIYRARFEREYRVTALLKNDHIVPIYDGGSWGDQLYIAMMLVDGPNLAEIMRRDGPLVLPRVVSIVNQMADALDDAHQQRVIHRDVKPANVLVVRNGTKNSEHIYLADFGLTLGMEGTRLTRTGGFMGTLAYTAPEQLNSAPIDGRADEYALAATTFHMLTGEMPYTRDNEMALINAQLFDAPPLVTDIRPDLPPRVADVIARGMAKRPEDRYRTCGDFAKALADAGARYAAAPTVAMRGAAAPPTSRSRVAVAAIVIGLLAAAVLGAVATYAVLSGAPAATPSPPSASVPGVAIASPTAGLSSAPSVLVTPDASAPSGSLLPTPTASADPSDPTKTPRPTPKGPPPTHDPGTTPTPTPTPTRTSPPTPTPTPTPTPPPNNLPLVANGNWSVDNSPRSVSGDPYVKVGEHRRRYVVTSQCDSLDSCRLAVNTFDSATGKRLGSIVFKWDGNEYKYRGGADWYRRQGGSSCQTSSGDVITDAYKTNEEVRVVPQGGSPSTHLTGTKIITGTPTSAGQAAGCAAFTMTYDVEMNTT